MSLQVDIVTPEGKLLSREVDSVIIPTELGETGILPGHVPLLAKVVRGELRLTQGVETDRIAVDKGFAEVIGSRVAILVEGAVDIDDVDLGTIEAAQRRAEEALEAAKDQNMDPSEIEQMETRLQFLMAQKLMKNPRN